MHKRNRIIASLFCAALTGSVLSGCLHSIIQEQRERAEDQENMAKTDEELIGTHFYVPRAGKDSVDVNIYIPQSASKDKQLPVVFNVHGGAFLAGDADMLDTQSDRISNDWNTIVVCVNYTLAKDGISIDYGTEELVDSVKYFITHADSYGIDTQKIILMGYSAGGFHAMAATVKLKAQGIDVYRQVLCYAFIKDIAESYESLSSSRKKSLAPALFVLADGDPISDGSLKYEELLRKNGVTTDTKKYNDAKHGFIEENNPEYEKMNITTAKSPEQEAMARDAERYIKNWLFP